MSHRIIVLFVLAAAAVRLTTSLWVFRLLTFPIQNYDSYIYVLKAMEINAGDWSPIATHGIGWPIALAPFIRIFGGASLFENLTVGIMVTACVSAMIVVPLAAIARRLLTSRQTGLVLASYAFMFPLVIPESHLLIPSEPLFTLLFLGAIACAYESAKRPAYAALAGILGGMAYAVRANGIFMLPVIVIAAMALYERRQPGRWSRITCMIAAFWAAAAPFLIQRALYFGSAFSYAENSKYFMEEYTDVWGAGYAPLGFVDYVSTHGLGEIFAKFAVRGLGIVMLYFFYSILPLVIPFLRGVGAAWRERVWMPIWAACGVWIVGLTPVFSLFYVTRHLFPIAPLAIIVAIRGWADGGGKGRKDEMALIAGQAIIFVVCLSIFLFSLRVLFKDMSRYVADGLAWTRWAAAHVKGTVAIGMGGDLLMMSLPDAKIGGRGMLDMTAPASGVSVMYPGKFDRWEDLMPVLRREGADYLVLDDRKSNPMPFVTAKYLTIYDGEDEPPYLTKIYSNYETQSQWKARIFKIDWKAYSSTTSEFDS